MKPLTRLLVHNWPLKLAALGLGVLLWLVVLMKTDPWRTREFETAIQAFRVPTGFQVISISPPKVRVTLAGRKSRVDDVSADQITARANLAGREAGEYEVPVTVLPGGLPRGVEVVATDRNLVVVSLDQTVEQNRAVKIVQRGRPAPGFVPVDSIARPNEVSVTGPRTTIEDVATAVAEVDISGLQETRTYTCLLEARDARNMPLQGVTIEPSRAEVTIQVERVNTKTVPVTLGEIVLPPGRTITSIDVSPPVVTVTGQPAALSALTFVRTGVVRFGAGATEVRADLMLPPGLKAVGGDSVRVSVTLDQRTAAPATRPAPAPAPATRPPTQATPDQPRPDATEPSPEPPEPEPPAEGGTPGPGDQPEPPEGGGDDGPGAG